MVEDVGEGVEDVGEERGLVAVGFWLGQVGTEVFGKEVGGVGFDHEFIQGDGFDGLAEVVTSAGVAEPAGDADVAVLVEVVEGLLGGAGEAVDHGVGEWVAVLF